MTRMPIATVEGMTILLPPGKHYQLIKGLIEEFAPHFVPGSRVLCARDTNEKWGYFDEEGLRAFGVKVDAPGILPDLVLYYPTKNWLILIDAITSHGPVDEKLRGELAKLFSRCTAGLIYVSAFVTRAELTHYLGTISWETEVWVAESPTHMIHFNGERLFAPFDQLAS